MLVYVPIYKAIARSIYHHRQYQKSIGAKCNFSILLIGNSCVADISAAFMHQRSTTYWNSDIAHMATLYQAPKCISLFVIYTRALSCDKWHNQRAPWSRRTLKTHFPTTTHTYTRGQMSSTSWDRSAVFADHGILAPHEVVKSSTESCIWERQLSDSGCVLYFLTLICSNSSTNLSLSYRNGTLKRQKKQRQNRFLQITKEWIPIMLTSLHGWREFNKDHSGGWNCLICISDQWTGICHYLFAEYF